MCVMDGYRLGGEGYGGVQVSVGCAVDGTASKQAKQSKAKRVKTFMCAMSSTRCLCVYKLESERNDMIIAMIHIILL